MRWGWCYYYGTVRLQLCLFSILGFLHGNRFCNIVTESFDRHLKDLARVQSWGR